MKVSRILALLCAMRGAVLADSLGLPYSDVGMTSDGKICIGRVWKGPNVWDQWICDGRTFDQTQQNINNLMAIYTIHLNTTTAALLDKTTVSFKELSDKLDKVVETTVKTNAVIVDKVNTFSVDLRSAINKRFDMLPAELLTTDAIKSLKAEILKEVDQKIAEALKK